MIAGMFIGSRSRLIFCLTAFSLLPVISVAAGDIAGAEFSVTPPVVSPWPVGIRGQPHVATNGDVYLVVWTDARAGSGAVYMTTLTAAGEVVDRSGTRVALGFVSTPKVVWNGRYFLITFFVDRCNLFITRATAAGELLDLTPTRLAWWPVNACPREHAITTNGRQSLLVVNNARSSEAILMDQEGERLGHLYLTQYIWYSAAVASDGRDFLAVVHEGTGNAITIRSIRIDPTGVQSNGAVIATGIDPPRLRLAWNGKEYALLLERDKSILARLIDISGSPVGEWIDIVSDPNLILRSEIVWNGDSFTVAYSRLGGQAGGLLAFSFDFKSRGATTTLSHDRRDVLFGMGSSGDGRTLIVWSLRSYESHLTAATFTTSSLRSAGPPQREELIGVTAAAQLYPDLLATSNGFAITWLERVSPTEFGIHLMATTASGEPLWSEPLLLGTTADDSQPRIGSDGTLVVVWWRTGLESLAFVRLTASLEPIDSAPLQTKWTNLLPADGRLLAIWREFRDQQYLGLAQIFRTSDLVPLSAETRMPWPAGFAVAGWSGRSFLLAWRQAPIASSPIVATVPPTNPPSQIVGARISADGLPLDAIPIQIAMQPRYYRDISIASNGTDFIVVWAESPPYRDGPYDILARVITADGNAQPGFLDSSAPRIAWSPSSERSPLVRRLGSDYLVGWITDEQTFRQSSIQFRRVASDVSPRTRVTTAAVFESESRSQVSFDARGESILMTYSRVAANSEHHGVPRVFSRRILRFVPIRQRPAGIQDDDS